MALSILVLAGAAWLVGISSAAATLALGYRLLVAGARRRVAVI